MKLHRITMFVVDDGLSDDGIDGGIQRFYGDCHHNSGVVCSSVTVQTAEVEPEDWADDHPLNSTAILANTAMLESMVDGKEITKPLDN